MTRYAFELEHPFWHGLLTCVPKFARLVWRRASQCLEEKGITFFFAWYDFWIGVFYDGKKGILYICPLPCCVIKVERRDARKGQAK